MLSTPEGVDRALAKLDTIKDQVVWWSAGAETPQLLADGEVVIGSTYNGRLFSVIEEQKQPVEMLWDYQVFDFDGWIVPADLPEDRHEPGDALPELRDRHPAARRPGEVHLLRPGAHLLAAAGRQARRPGIEMAPHMPTNPENQKNYLVNNIEWWADNQDEVEANASRPGSPSSRQTRAGPHRPRPPPTGGRRMSRCHRRTGTAGAARRADARRRRHAAEGEPAPRAAGAEAPARCCWSRRCSLFVLITFLFPIGDMLFRSVENQIVAGHAAAHRRGARGLGSRPASRPDEPAFAALHDDLVVAVEAKTNTRLGTRLNYEMLRACPRSSAASAATSEDMDPARRSASSSSTSTRSGAIRRSGRRSSSSPAAYTAGYLLNAVDLQLTPDGIALQARAPSAST